MVIARTYIWNKEYKLALKRLKDLKVLIINYSLDYIKRRYDIAWYHKLLSSILRYKKEDKEACKKIEELIKENKIEKIEKGIKKLIGELKNKGKRLPEEIESLMNVSDLITGYKAEVIELEKNNIALFGKELKKLP